MLPIERGHGSQKKFHNLVRTVKLFPVEVLVCAVHGNIDMTVVAVLVKILKISIIYL